LSRIIPEILKLCSSKKFAKLKNPSQGLLKYCGVSGNLIAMKSGQSLNIGKRPLNFINVPMIH
jgi:flavorubredoxin